MGWFSKVKRFERVQAALDIVDDDLPDGAWMAHLEELTGLDAGDIAEALFWIAQRRPASARKDPK